jgi:hypothetical protein
MRARLSSLVAACLALTAASAHAQTAPWTNSPASASGTELLPPTGTSAAGPVPAPSADARMKELERRLAELEAENARRDQKLSWLEHVKLSGYVQAQFISQWYNTAASPNLRAGELPPGIDANDTVARADGATTNLTLFRFRRVRPKLELYPSEYAKVVIEIDPGGLVGGAVPNGTGAIARNIYAVGIVPWSKDVRTEIAMGSFKVPFGYEQTQSSSLRPFIERSWMNNNFFPGAYDIGLRTETKALSNKLTVLATIVNGYTLAERYYALLPDLNKGKDVVGRANYDFGPFDLGISGLAGQGQRVDTPTLRFKQFRRWAVNLEGAIHHPFIRRLGETKVFAELTVAQNLDRGVFYDFGTPDIPADIHASVDSRNERGVFVRLEQDLSRWFTLGLRYDMYTPDTQVKNDARDTYGFVGVVHFTQGLQLMLEYDYSIDNVHRRGTPAPSKEIFNFSGVLQAKF